MASTEPILTDDQVRWAYQKRCEGYTLYEIGEALYVNHNTVSYALRRKKLKKPPKAPLVYKEGWDKDGK